MKNTWMTCLLATCAASFAPHALAQETEAPSETASDTAESPEAPGDRANDEPQGPKMHLGVAPPSAPVQRTDYVHEGFYFRFGAGPGFLSTSSDGVGDSGFSLGSELLVGGSPAPGMTFGGGVLTDLAFAGSDPGVHLLAGPFFDAFPNNKGGWHLGALVGLGMLAGGGDPLIGGGGAVWAGHDFWVAPEWSAGFNLRLGGSRVVGPDIGATNFTMHLLFTVLNH